MLNLGYPGGPVVSAKAAEFEKSIAAVSDKELKKELQAIEFPRPMLEKPGFDFSFSGLKTAVLYFVKELEQRKIPAQQRDLFAQAICNAFQEATVDVLTAKTFRAVKKYHPVTLLVAGGVAANKLLVSKLKQRSDEFDNLQFIHPRLEYCGDNAAMIAIAAAYRYNLLEKKNKLADLDIGWSQLEANANLKLSEIK
jgi:N6-L-threonylcarbamoyladenine synthase